MFFSNCGKQYNNDSSEAKLEEQEIYINDINQIINSENKPSLPSGFHYFGIEDIYSPDGKMLRIYSSEIFETEWGPVYDAPIIYLYDKENNVLGTYDVFVLIFERSWGGNIRITYNNDRNSFDMVFSLDSYGNYGTGYIDLNTNKFVRELLSLPKDETFERQFERQGIPEDYIEDSNSKL